MLDHEEWVRWWGGRPVDSDEARAGAAIQTARQVLDAVERRWLALLDDAAGSGTTT